MALRAGRPLQPRIVASFVSLGITWLIASMAIGGHKHDVGALIGFGIWTIPFLTAGWLVFGIPAIFLSERIRSFPLLALILGVVEALGWGADYVDTGRVPLLEVPGGALGSVCVDRCDGMACAWSRVGAVTSLLYTSVLFLGASPRQQKTKAP